MIFSNKGSKPMPNLAKINSNEGKIHNAYGLHLYMRRKNMYQINLNGPPGAHSPPPPKVGGSKKKWFWDLSYSIANCLKRTNIIVPKSRFWKTESRKKFLSPGNQLFLIGFSLIDLNKKVEISIECEFSFFFWKKHLRKAFKHSYFISYGRRKIKHTSPSCAPPPQR